jgi:hypothetical protein
MQEKNDLLRQAFSIFPQSLVRKFKIKERGKVLENYNLERKTLMGKYWSMELPSLLLKVLGPPLKE